MAHDSRTFQDGDFSRVTNLQRAGPHARATRLYMRTGGKLVRTRPVVDS